MKRILSLILAISLVACLGVVFVACDKSGSADNGDNQSSVQSGGTTNSSDTNNGTNGSSDSSTGSSNNGSSDSSTGSSNGSSDSSTGSSNGSSDSSDNGSPSVGPKITKQDWISALNANNFCATGNGQNVYVDNDAALLVTSWYIIHNGELYRLEKTDSEYIAYKSNGNGPYNFSLLTVVLDTPGDNEIINESTFEKLCYDEDKECYSYELIQEVTYEFYFKDGVLTKIERKHGEVTAITITLSQYGKVSLNVPKYTFAEDEDNDDNNNSSTGGLF